MNTMTYTLATPVYMVPIEDVRLAGFNPASRTEPRRLRKLMEEIKRAGCIITPLQVGADGVLADGHRRYACAKALGMTHVPVQFATLPAATLYAILNTGTEPQRGIGWSQAVAQGFPLSEVRGDNKALIELWQTVLGPEDFAEMAARRSPEIVRVARGLANFVGRGEDMAFLRAAILWMDRHNMHRMYIEARRDGISPAALVAAVEEDRPLSRRWA